ncbi:anthranilate synthase component II [Pontibacillus litoralis]|uniref:Glutamine amidotransferase domain-containing protein n=1 Tax=Pontibacillus litoralis JSM 072002 TaxID=1385512 RepID=A0A0A5G6D8_9BACI|nr:aminodeoxychorismate/anthranilate synthase component II [Pontibacillus litoralis]KGX87589.1 hypothetical protein N784_15185 [Pontibacillus litoralis JSM 072002]
MIVLIDHYDSFTYNLVQYIQQITGDVQVLKCDQTTVAEIKQLNPQAIVLSPGPGTPEETGVSKEVLRYFHQHVPILGICLGHQLIVEYFGGTIMKGKQPIHGKVDSLYHDGLLPYEGVNNPTDVTRYHSLIAEESTLPSCLQVTSRTADGVIMGIRHHCYSIEGMQFHPEAILTTEGYHMLNNYFRSVVGLDEATKGVKQ